MNQNLFAKLLYSSLVISCIDPQILMAMDVDERNLKRPLEGGGNEFDRPQKRQCLPLDLSQIPLDDIIEAAYEGNKDCRDCIVDKVFRGFIGLKSSNISLSKLLCFDQRKISVETLTPSELHLICVHNPDNILATDVGKSLLEAIKARAELENDPWAQNTLASVYAEGIPGIVDKNLDIAFKLFTQAADQGHSGAQNLLGYMYKIGNGTVKNPEMTLKLLTQAADQGSARAQCNLANLYFYGEGVAKNLEQAVYWNTQSANQGFASAQYNLGVMCVHGMGVEKNLEQAVHWYAHAADQGLATAKTNLGNMYRQGEGVAKNLERAVHWITQAANQGNVQAQLNLGNMYRQGEGVAKNLERVVHWYTQAANQGHALAQYNLGLLYYNGEGVAKNLERAVHWYTQAANQGDAQAQFYLGLLYYKGEGVAKKLERAVHWYTQAANQGDAQAQFSLGLLYYKGEGVAKNLERAVHWYTQAANQGHASAQFNLGVMYDNGEGVEKNAVTAVHWYMQAANQGYASAQFNLGVMYDNGESVEKNAVTAVHWYMQAAIQGDAEAQTNLKLDFKIVPQTISIQNQEEIKFDINNIENILSEINCLMGLHELRNNPERGINTQGIKIAIPSLLPYYEQCGQFAIDMFGILKHLNSQEVLAQGFLVNCLGLGESPLAKDLAAQLRVPNYRGNFMHCLENPISGDLYFSFEKDEMTKNLYYTYLIQEFLDPKSQRNLDLTKAVKHLKKVYEGKIIIRLESEGALIQDNLAKMCSGVEKESAKFAEETKKLADLNKKIEEEKIMMEAFENILLIKEKVLEIVLSSANPSNLEFQKNSPLWNVLNK